MDNRPSSSRPSQDAFSLLRACAKACDKKDPEALKAALASGDAFPALQEDFAQVLLDGAVSAGSLSCAQLLIDAGAPLSGRGAFGGSLPLGSAAASGDAEMCLLLINAGADISKGISDTRPDLQMSPLCLAAKGGRCAALETLLNAGAQINEQSGATRSTALLLAVDAGAPINCIALLLERGADMSIPNDHGDTAMFLAAYRHQTDVIELMEGAKLKRSLNASLARGLPVAPRAL